MSSKALTAQPILDAQAQLGEGAFWNHQTQELWWIDIEGMRLHIFDPQTKANKTIQLDQRIGTVVPNNEGHAIIALQDGIYQLDLKDQSQKLLAPIEADLKENRMNDGKCDPAGRLWAGTMNVKGEAKKGALYCIETDGAHRKMLDSISISNGIVWSADHQRMYYIDTPDRNVKGYDYDKATGNITNESIIIRIPKGMGYPDGMTIDAEGMLWIAMWDGNCVTRWNPKSGQLLQKIEVPAHNVSSCAFGGPNLDTLYITSARVDMKPEELEALPLAGGLFSVVPGVVGVKSSVFGGQ